MLSSGKYYLILSLFLISGCATLPENNHPVQSFAYTGTSNTTIGIHSSDKETAHPGQSGFHLLGNGLDAFAARVLLIHKAERSIDAQYYLFHNDLVGKLFMEQLLKAADRGVRISFTGEIQLLHIA